VAHYLGSKALNTKVGQDAMARYLANQSMSSRNQAILNALMLVGARKLAACRINKASALEDLVALTFRDPPAKLNG
jgi:hypothetical protein